MALIASKGTLDWAYPPFILASTAAAMDMEVAVFFTFYGLPLLMKDLKAKVAPHANPAMPMKMPFGPKAFQEKLLLAIPNFVAGDVPGFETFATAMMNEDVEKKGVATIEGCATRTLEAGARLIGCQMTMDVFGFTRDQLIDEVEIGGAAIFLAFAADAEYHLVRLERSWWAGERSAYRGFPPPPLRASADLRGDSAVPFRCGGSDHPLTPPTPLPPQGLRMTHSERVGSTLSD